MISIGSLIIQAAGIFIAALVLLEYLQPKLEVLESLISRKALPAMIDGQIVVPNLRKLRFTVDKLEMRLRRQGIAKTGDIKAAPLEANGSLAAN